MKPDTHPPSITGWWARLAHYGQENASVAADAGRENVFRLLTGIAVLVPLNLLYIVAMLTIAPTSNPQEALWRETVLWAHSASALFNGLLWFPARYAARTPGHHWLDRLVVYLGIWSFLAFTGTIAVMDQWVTASIAPLLIGCTTISVLYLMRPTHMLILSGLMAVAMVLGIEWSQTSPLLRMTNQLNAVAVVCMGAMLSIILWRRYVATVLLQRALALANATLLDQQRELQAQATHDPLTNLYNRREFNRLVELETARATRQNLPTAFVLADLDHFKRVNDEHGHPAGDAVLVHTARVLTEHLRSIDVMARFGGEELLVMLPGTDTAGALALAEKLRLRLAESSVAWQGQTIRITASFGVVVRQPGQPEPLEALYACADEALYRAKESGRNRVELALGHGPLPPHATP